MAEGHWKEFCMVYRHKTKTGTACRIEVCYGKYYKGYNREE